MLTKEKVIDIAHQIRNMLKQEFPESPNMEKQCKRAAILFDLYCKNHEWYDEDSFLVSGHIAKDEDERDYERGHVWNKVYIEDRWYVLDLTLTQFSTYLEKEIPPVVLGIDSTIYPQFSYQPDGLGEYEYNEDDVRWSLVEKVKALK